MEEFKLNPDYSVSKSEEDSFQRYPFAKRIADLIKANVNDASLVIGIYGRWGEGKTSVLNFIDTELKTDANNVTIHFNPWLFSDENQLLLSFFHQLTASLNVSLKNRSEKLGDFLKSYAGVIGTITSFAGYGSKEMLEAIGTKLADKPLNHYKDQINKAIIESGKRIIVFVDDIDRLTVDEVQSVFKIVKLAANFSNTTYVLAFDDEYVAEALGTRYSKGGHDFLEKIIQLPLKLPQAQPAALRKFTFSKIQSVIDTYNTSIDQSEINRFNEVFDDSFLDRIDNPRIATRFSNSISFSIPLLKDEANTVDIMLIEGAKSVFPAAYSFIRDNYELFTTNYNSNSEYDNKRERSQSAISTIKNFLEAQPAPDRDNIKKLFFELFPQIKGIFHNTVYGENRWQSWYRAMRICSPHHFTRYFAYTVIEGEISDKFFSELFRRLIHEDFLNERNSLLEQCKTVDPEKLILKIQLNESTLSTENSFKLALNLPLLEDYFPNPAQMFSFMTPFSQATGLISRLVHKQDRGKSRLKLGTDIIKRVKSIPFGLAVWRKLHPHIEKPESEWAFSEVDFKKFSKEFYNSALKQTSLADLFANSQEGDLDDILNIYVMFNEAGLQKFTFNFIKTDKQSFLKLLYAYSETTYSSGRADPYKSGFSKNHYDKLKRVVEIEKLFKQSIKYYGKPGDLDAIDTTVSMYKPLSDEELTRIFQKIYLLDHPGN